MASSGRRGKNAERVPAPGLRRPSNPRMVAKAGAPAVRPPSASGRRGRGARTGAKRPLRAPLPDSVTMGPATVVRGGEGARAGVLYRLVVSDADGKAIAAGAYTIRKHVLAVSATGCFAPGNAAARIGVVALDAEGGAFDLVEHALSAGAAATAGGLGEASRARVEGEETVFEYFSFELGGVTYAIPKSGFLLVKKRRGRRLEVTRTPRAGGSIHGAVVAGLVRDDGADGFSFEVA